MKKNDKNWVKGYSLVELLLYIAIASITISSISAYIFIVYSSKIKTETIEEVEQNGTRIMQILTQTIRNASDINSPSLGNTSSSLSLNTSTVSKNPTVFDLNNSVVRITEGTGAPINLTSNRVRATNLSFANVSRNATPGAIRITLTLKHINPDNKNEYNYSQTFYNTATVR